jgi:hypothetical protein
MTCIKCVGFAIPPPPIVKNIPEVEPTIPSLGGFTYFRFSKDFAMPS